jgi:hypothetical protein
MLFLTRWFGVTVSDSERHLAEEKSVIEEIAEKVLLLQAKSAAEQKRAIGRGTHVKGVCVRGEFEVLDLFRGREAPLAARLAKGIFATPGVYPAVVRFANADSKKRSDFKPDVRALSFSVDLTRSDASGLGPASLRQDFSLQNTTTLPINDARAFLATMKVITASNPAVGMLALSFRDKLRVMRTVALARGQEHQKIMPYQHLRYWSNVPFRHGPNDVVKYSAIPSADNTAHPLQRSNPKGLQDELVRHLNEDAKMSVFGFGVQFLDTGRMTYGGQHHDANFWIENASVEWAEKEAPFHIIARLTLQPKSQLLAESGEAVYFDVTRHSTSDSTPVGSINRARGRGEMASREARLRSPR